ncbi:MAG: DUF3467 domain-containing protein [Candidatus Kapaibacterium sp.]|jgi:hypothetical protein
MAKKMNDQDNNQGGQQINVELGEKEAEGIYSNLAIISHSPAEFVIDFTRILPGVPRAKVHARIVMTPQHARLLLNALEDNIDKYEDQYGAIVVNGGTTGGDFNFPIPDVDEKAN